MAPHAFTHVDMGAARPGVLYAFGSGRNAAGEVLQLFVRFDDNVGQEKAGLVMLV